MAQGEHSDEIIRQIERTEQDIQHRLAVIEKAVDGIPEVHTQIALISSEVTTLKDRAEEERLEAQRWQDLVRTTYATNDKIGPWIALQKTTIVAIIGLALGAVMFIASGGAL